MLCAAFPTARPLPDVYKRQKLGGAEWQRTRAKVKKATEEMAQALIELYARRRQATGYAFPPDGDWQRDFETRFDLSLIHI